ncbi:DUF1330 domain-containing protein [Rhodovastum sp. RN2-1]|uniref:DUF1330 domain-containing protein n=2 Tax=Limobrevibacterium gyesilva TaxID=2991712 RepID=A0AA42CHW6_9PROT|nr:DUF1330 domain-containing protein [Limobrevibacterium gyesilva]MCW3475382.1 DUF1330 domain-containing protein [Limobrevibacterium gyesilva]
MVAYVIFTREKTRNPAQLEVYKEKVPAAFAGHAVTFRARHCRFEVPEGPAAEDVLMLEFPSFEAAKEWYAGPAYQDASSHRFQGADYRCIIVEGLEQPA